MKQLCRTKTEQKRNKNWEGRQGKNPNFQAHNIINDVVALFYINA